jgi:hypothetical protein
MSYFLYININFVSYKCVLLSVNLNIIRSIYAPIGLVICFVSSDLRKGRTTDVPLFDFKLPMP